MLSKTSSKFPVGTPSLDQPQTPVIAGATEPFLRFRSGAPRWIVGSYSPLVSLVDLNLIPVSFPVLGRDLCYTPAPSGTPQPKGRLTMRHAFIVVVALVVVACGSSSPTTPTPNPQPQPQPQANRAPTITSMSVSPAFGISQLTNFTFTGSATDPDGDAVTYAWDLGGDSVSGQTLQGTISSWGSFTARLVVTDSKGATATDTRPLTVGSMQGRWRGTIPGYTNLAFDLKQNLNVVTGTFFDQFFGAGEIDPAEPGRIALNGNVTMRVKLAAFTDFRFEGKMDTSGRRITGGVFGSGFTGQAFTMTKQ